MELSITPSLLVSVHPEIPHFRMERSAISRQRSAQPLILWVFADPACAGLIAEC
jgi:hypothetical protein